MLEVKYDSKSAINQYRKMLALVSASLLCLLWVIEFKKGITCVSSLLKRGNVNTFVLGTSIERKE